MTKETGKLIIEQKVQDFEKNAVVLKKKGHGETNIRSNYIDVLFEALGWDMKSHYEVDREFSQKDTSGTKKVDYAFKLNGKTKFFIEAKEASVDLVNNKDAIHQAKRYAYSTNGKAPIVILTDFEEFRVFNVMKAPVYDNPNRELLPKYSMVYTDYINNWDLLWDTFSKPAVGNGSLDALRGKLDKNTKTMDVDFLEQITGWRETLARNIAIRNKELKVEELNEAVQRILDRFLFIRNLEDREIEPENLLLEKTKSADGIYKSIIPIFTNLDNVYNGLMFKKHFSEDLIIDDKTLKDIIKNMCYPISPFQFDVIEPEILGRIYEKFLGSKIRLTENHQAKVEEKIEVRKAGGVYYTPEYIVNYIVENTVGKKIEGLTPEEIKKIKIVDPACGSGSFLLGAYSYILAYHEKWYLAHKTDKSYKNDFYITKGGELKVNLDKRGDILRNNLFGVDIDQEATEVAIMSLYLKMLDDGFDKGAKDLFFIKGHVLPDMTNNIKCGNSLIGSDYFDGRLEFTHDEFIKIKPFDWDKEFADIFSDKLIEEKLEAFHITWATYNSRPEGKENYGSPVLLDNNSRNAVAEYIDEKIGNEKYRIISINILNDHVHCILVCSKEKLAEVVRNIKGYSSYKLHRFLPQDPTLKRGVDSANAQIDDYINPMLQHGVGMKHEIDSAQNSKGSQKKLWAKNYSTTYLNDEEHLINALNYIENNHLKHQIAPMEYKFRNLTPIVEAFLPMKTNGGFDCVIGNPPWVSLTGKFGNDIMDKRVMNHLVNKYNANTYMPNLYEYFVYKGLDLISETGCFSFIVPDRLGFNSQFVNLRKKILEYYHINELIYKAPFPGIVTDTLIFNISNKMNDFANYQFNVGEFGKSLQIKTHEDYQINNDKAFFYESSDNAGLILGKVFNNKRCSPLGEVADSTSGFGGKSTKISLDRVSDKQIEIIRGRSINKYSINKTFYFEFIKSNITGRTTDKSKLGTKEKVLLRKTGYPIFATFDGSGLFPEQSLYFIFNIQKGLSLKYITGLVNSPLFQFVYINKLVTNKDSTPQLKKIDLDKFPILVFDFSNPSEKQAHDTLVSLVDNMLQTQKDSRAAKSESDKSMYVKKINMLDNQINQLVYKLYDLTDEEIRIVEGV
jgi:REP element-mobilizing transposase RayT